MSKDGCRSGKSVENGNRAVSEPERAMVGGEYRRDIAGSKTGGSGVDKRAVAGIKKSRREGNPGGGIRSIIRLTEN